MEGEEYSVKEFGSGFCLKEDYWEGRVSEKVIFEPRPFIK